MWWRVLAIALLGVFSTSHGRSWIQRIQTFARQIQHVPNLIQEICASVDRNAQLLDAALVSPVSDQEKQKRGQVGQRQGWACAKCKKQLDNQFQVLKLRRGPTAICSTCIQNSLSGQC